MKTLSGIFIITFVTIFILTGNVHAAPTDSLTLSSKPTVVFSLGIGFVDLLNVKFRLHIKQVQLAVGAGFFLSKTSNLSSVMGDL